MEILQKKIFYNRISFYLEFKPTVNASLLNFIK